MHRRLTVAAAAVAAIGLPALALAPSAGAVPKNQIRIVGGVVVKPGKFVMDNQRFKKRDTTVKSGATVKLVNRSETEDPHTITFVEKRFLPEQFESGIEEQLFAAHQVDPNNEEAPPGVLVVDNGAAVPEGGTLNVDTGFSKTVLGDSAFIAPGQKSFSFKVTADKGSKLFYFCAVHPWMQGKITVR
jgi:plastocyanin